MTVFNVHTNLYKGGNLSRKCLVYPLTQVKIGSMMCTHNCIYGKSYMSDEETKKVTHVKCTACNATILSKDLIDIIKYSKHEGIRDGSVHGKVKS